MDLGVGVYDLTRRLPSDERFGLTAQLRRAAVSVPSNIAEGWGRGSTREYLQFIRYARASLKELETQWHLAARIGYFEPHDLDPLDELSERLGKRLLALVRALAKRA
jgi:four helix bundle protein